MMPHIHTETGQHDHTASAFIVRLGGESPHLLLHRHKKLGIWLQFGGHIELDETPWQAVIHELEEESGYSLDQLQLLQPRDRIKSLSRAVLHPYPVAHNTHKFDTSHMHTDVSYAFVASEEAVNPVSEDESGEMRPFTLEELGNYEELEIVGDVAAIGQFVIQNCLPHWERVSLRSFKA